MKERELFLAALDIEDHAARQAHLHAACADDAELLARVQSLLASHEGQSQFLNTPVVEQIADVADSVASATIAYEGGSTHDDDDPDATTFYFHGPAPMTKQQDDAEFENTLGYLEPSTKPGSLGRLGHYEMLEVIGRGAFGTVLRAFDEKLHRVVAIKVMAPEMAATSPARKRFLREAQASAAIRHEHVVSVYAVEEKPLPYLVMEFIPGLTLQQRLDERGPLDVPTVLRIGWQIAEGLAAAHAQDLIHRDIKPANILLETGAREMVKVTDFGLARAADDASLTQSGTIAGTPMYMAPEQAQGQKLDQRADLFSFGSVMYQMVSGRPPFRAASTLAVLKRLAEDTPRPIREIIPETPQWLCDIITKLHAKNPDDRYQSAREVADVLADCEAQLKANARLQDFSRIPSSKSASSVKWKLFTAGGVVGAVLLLGAIIITLTNKDGTKTRIEVSDTSQVEITTENTSVSRAASAPGQSDTSDKVRGLTPSGSPKKDVGWHAWPADAPPPAIAPFDAAQAQSHQEAWAKYLGIPATFHDKHGTKYVLIAPGEFQMGYSADEVDTLTRELKQAGASEYDQFSASTSGPQHKVRITKPCYMSAHEVTVAEYRRFIDDTHYMTTAEQLGGVRKKWTEYLAPENPDRHPVLGVSWTDAEMFCVLRGKDDGVTYRLPSEAEWEYACRAGTTTLWSFGDNPAQIGEHAVTSANGTATQPVGSKKPNPFGLFDMYGNAEEWCLDWHIRDYFAKSPVDDPVNLATPTDSNSGRVARGGGTISLPWQLRSSIRRWDYPSTPVNLKGFRVVIVGDLKKAVENIARSGWHGWPTEAPPPAIAPFNAEQAKQHQEAWAKYLGVPVEYTNSLGMKFRLIPPGEFTMGSTQEEIAAALKDVAPNDKVILTQPIYLGVNEVTQAEYEKVMGVNPSHFAPLGIGKEAVAGLETAEHPVEEVSWNDAAEFCAKLSKQEKLKPFYFRAGETIEPLDGTGYRLPSEAEWEFACRAGTATKYWIGDKDGDLVRAGWFSGNSGGRTHAAGELKANPFGLADIHGNVWEWVQDGWDATFDGQSQDKPAINPNVPFHTCTQRVLRGGHWGDTAYNCRSWNHLPSVPTSHNLNIGFRVALPADTVKAVIASSNTIDSAKAKRRFASDEWIDVIPLIDPQADKWHIPQRTGKNAWRVERGELVVGGDALVSKLVLPLDSDWPAFECELEFTRRAGESGFNVNLPSKVGECPVVFDAPGHSGGVWLGSRTKGVLLKDGPQIVTGQRAKIRIEVRRQQDAEQVSVALNDAKVGEWSGDRNAIANTYKERFPHDRQVSLWIHPGGNEFVFHRIRVRMLDGGTAESLRPVSSNQPVAPAKKELPSVFKNSIGMEFVIVPKGKSWLGGGKDKLGDKEVNITADFYLGKYHVTQEEWEQVMEDNPSYYSRNGAGKDEVKDVSDEDLKRFPVDYVSWDACQIFVARLNRMEKDTGWVYRLPKEVEWEYACRGGPMSDRLGSAFDFYFAKPTNAVGTRANLNTGTVENPVTLGRTCKVGLYEPNALGLHDMHGNLHVWCDDAAKTFDDADGYAQRGGAWNSPAEFCSAGRRITRVPSNQSQSQGLRLARVPSGAPSPAAMTPDSTVVQALRELVAAKDSERDQAKQSFLDGQLSKLDLIYAELDATEARIQLTQAEQNVVANLAAFRRMVAFREQERELILEQLKAGTVKEDVLERTDSGLADARGRLNKAIAEAPSSAFFTEADAQRIAALPAEQQVEEVRKELVRHNPSFDGKVEHKIEAGVVTELKLITDEIIDISPVRALQGLVSLKLSATPLPGKRGKLSDISPLRGLPLTHLDLGCTEVTNIEVVREMPLKDLSLDRVPVTDLSPLTGKVLKSLHFGGTKVKSLSEVPIASSEVIHCHLPQISDKSELQRWGVRFLDLWGVPATVDPERLRELKPPLSRVNGKPLEEFLKDVEKK